MAPDTSRNPAASTAASRTRRLAWWTAAALTLAGIVYLMATAKTGPVDPTETRGHQSHATVVFNSAIIVSLRPRAKPAPVARTETRGPKSPATVVFNSAIIFSREGLEAILIFAAVTASMVGANSRHRRPVTAGALTAFGAAVVTWFL